MVLLANTVKKLQRSLNALRAYSIKWGMEIKKIKSQIIVFKMGGPLIKYEKWIYNRETIKIVNAYLGLMLTPKLVWTKACMTVSEQTNGPQLVYQRP